MSYARGDPPVSLNLIATLAPARSAPLYTQSIRIDSPVWSMANEVTKGSPAAGVIAEEERLYGQVQARVALGEDGEERPQIGSGDLDADLLSLRDQIAEAR